MKTICKRLLKAFLMIAVGYHAVICQINESESIERANLITSDYFKITKYNSSNELRLKYQESWLVNNYEVTTENTISKSNFLLKHEETSRGGDVLFSRTAILNDRFYLRSYISGQGKDSVKLDLSKPEEKNNSEIRLLKWKASTLFFPITLKFPADHELKFKYLGVAEAKDKTAYVLEHQQSQNVTLKILFDVDTNLPTMWKYSSTSKDGKVINYDFYLSDYRVLNGVKVPTKIEVYLNQSYKNHYIISDFLQNPQFDSNLFEK